MTEYTPTTDEGWALVDLLKDILEDFTDEPQFTRAEHALMAAGQIRREWLAEHDAALVERMAAEIRPRAKVEMDVQSDGDPAASLATANAALHSAADTLEVRAAEIREGTK